MPHPGQATATSRILARTTITSPPSATSSRTRADNLKTRSPLDAPRQLWLIDASAQSAATESATEPKYLLADTGCYAAPGAALAGRLRWVGGVVPVAGTAWRPR